MNLRKMSSAGSAKRSMKSNLTPIEVAVIDALTKEDLLKRGSLLADECVAVIIGRRPDFAELLPKRRGASALQSESANGKRFAGVVEELSEHEIPSNAADVIKAVIDGIVAYSAQEKETKTIDRLNDLVSKWRGRPGTDPVAAAITAGNNRLDTVLRSRWQSLENLSDIKAWSDRLPWDGVGKAFASAARVIPEQFKLELGFSIGVRIAAQESEPSRALVKNELKKLGLDPLDQMVNVLMPMAKLWAALRSLAKYESDRYSHGTELVGLRAKVAGLAELAPELWAQALRWILARSSELGNVAEAVTLELATNNAQVRRALERARRAEAEHVRLMAAGLWTVHQGVEDPGSALASTLASAAARYMDGIPIFPHPLEPMSATWLGSIGIEQAIATGVQRATTRFAAEVRDQGGNIEEALTNSLIKEIGFEFNQVKLRVKALGSTRSRQPTPVLSVQQRPVSKSLEEPTYGCDLAWLLEATVRGCYFATWVDLVQVKKSKALQGPKKKRSVPNSWKIEVKQLLDILKWSATAVYWLIASDGEVLVIQRNTFWE